jgi:hypothetical protein
MYVPMRNFEVVQLYFSNVRHMSTALQLRNSASAASPGHLQEAFLDSISRSMTDTCEPSLALEWTRSGGTISVRK